MWVGLPDATRETTLEEYDYYSKTVPEEPQGTAITMMENNLLECLLLCEQT